MEPIIRNLLGKQSSPLSGKRIKLLDGNCLEKSHHRIKDLRDIAAPSLPGESLVVYDLLLHMLINVFPYEDGHAQERSLLKTVLETIDSDDAWIADRNFVWLNSPAALISGPRGLLSVSLGIILSN